MWAKINLTDDGCNSTLYEIARLGVAEGEAGWAGLLGKMFAFEDVGNNEW